MFSRFGVALLLVGTSSIGQAQGSPSPDSLVAHWLKYGAVSNWQPHHLFTGCPRLEEWQKRGIDLLLTADLSAERTGDLARAWMFPLQNCQSARLEKWYFDRTNAAIQRGDPNGNLLTFWIALREGDSPGIRQYLRNIMLDVTTPERYRSSAGAALFNRFGPEDRLREYLSAFETRRMPFEISVGETATLLKADADRLLREVGSRVRSNPELADQLAFTGIVESSPRYASPSARRSLGEALEAGLSRPGLTDKQRNCLEGSARFLKQQGT
jgi:hypothetical protein